MTAGPDRDDRHRNDGQLDVLVVGAGPTGLSLAVELAAFGVVPRVIDRVHDRTHESRALAIQPRTLEVLAGVHVTDELVACGNRGVRLRLHFGRRLVEAKVFDLGVDDTAYPFLLFLSQAETERILGDHLAASGVTVERGVELVDLRPDADGVVATLRHDDGSHETAHARYVVGCDGAHSTVRRLTGIPFEGGAYPQTFVLADAEADGIEPGAAHAFISDRGILFFFPLGAPASWRMLAMRQRSDATRVERPLTLDEVQSIADLHTAGQVRLHDPVWMTNFRLHHRGATRYRAGGAFLAGDAAHIHSPAGGQGMNTGIQDAVNLGWKLALVVSGRAGTALLDTYEPERAPVGRAVLRFTDRAFTAATSTNAIVRLARNRVVPLMLPLALRSRTGRAFAFRTLSQLGIRYRRSALSSDGPNPPRRGPRAGDRLPDAEVIRDGRPTTLHAAIAAPGWHLLLCGPVDRWAASEITRLTNRYSGLLRVHHLTTRDGPDLLYDQRGLALRRLGMSAGDSVAYVLRPDGHIGFRAGGTDLTWAARYLGRWLAATSRAESID